MASFTVKALVKIESFEKKIRVRLSKGRDKVTFKYKKITENEIIVEFVVFTLGFIDITLLLDNEEQFTYSQIPVLPGPIHIPSTKVTYPDIIQTTGSEAFITVCFLFFFMCFKNIYIAFFLCFYVFNIVIYLIFNIFIIYCIIYYLKGTFLR